MIKIVNYAKEQNKKLYGYAICECTLWGEAIQVPRESTSGLISFNCPRCGKQLGLYLTGKDDNIL